MKQLLAIILLAGLTAAGFLYYKLMVQPAVPENTADSIYLYVPTGASYEQVYDSLQRHGIATDRMVFDQLAERMSYRKPVMRSGRFALEPGMSYVGLVRKLRGGQQAPVQLVLTNEREPMNVAAKAARFIEADSQSIVSLLQNRVFLDSIGYSQETLQSLFIPNTYQVYWNLSARDFVQRMQREHEQFWAANDRRAKAEQLGMTESQVYTLASIVEKETTANQEKKRMAGVYLNRLRDGWPLQADPTAVFATRDFGTPRVLNYHTQFDSPYNTYKYPGLPPGPIAMASIPSIDAVLNAEQHDYYFFCAVGDGSGLHNYAETLAAHNRNIEVYTRNLRQRGLR